MAQILNGRSLTKDIFYNASFLHLNGVSLFSSIRSFCVIFTIFPKAPQPINGWADLTLYVQWNRALEAAWLADSEYPAGSDWHLSVIQSNLSISGEIFDTSSWMLASYSTNLEKTKESQQIHLTYPVTPLYLGRRLYFAFLSWTRLWDVNWQKMRNIVRDVNWFESFQTLL